MKLKYTIFATLIASIGGASAAAISVNFTEDANRANQNLPTTTAAGIGGYTHWNNVDARGPITDPETAGGTQGSLLDSSGTVTAVSVTWDAQGGGVWGDATADTDANGGVGDAMIRRGYIDDNGGDASSSITFSMSGITYANYDLIIYYSSGDGNNPQTQGANVGGNVITPTAAAGANNQYGTNPNWDSTNTVTFSNLSGASFSGFTLDRNATGTGRASLAGIQIVEIVPEPSSAALLGLGGLALILRRRK